MTPAAPRPSAFIRGVITGIGLMLFTGADAFAQEPSPAPQRAGQAGVTIEEVIVTGSNIPTSEEVGPNPVLIINRDFIEKSGYRTAEELIRNLTVAGPNGVPTSNNGTGSAPGAPTQ